MQYLETSINNETACWNSNCHGREMHISTFIIYTQYKFVVALFPNIFHIFFKWSNTLIIWTHSVAFHSVLYPKCNVSQVILLYFIRYSREVIWCRLCLIWISSRQKGRCDRKLSSIFSVLLSTCTCIYHIDPSSLQMWIRSRSAE